MVAGGTDEIEGVDPCVEGSLEPVLRELCADDGLSRRHRARLPSRDAVDEIVELLRSLMFPGYFGPVDLAGEALRFRMGTTLHRVATLLEGQIERGFALRCPDHPEGCGECQSRAVAVVRAFVARLPHVRRLLATDVRAAYEGDPAATSPDEAIFCYPGILAIAHHRLAHELYALDVPLIPRMIAERAHAVTGIDIHPGARIGPSFFVDHGTGVVIGETAIVGERVRLYQGVTLGARSFPLDDAGHPVKGVPRHPIVEDDVIVYAGATILGRVTVGKGSVVGGNVWLTKSVPPGTRVSQTAPRSAEFEGGGGI